ncbi:MAG: hypothetical protein IKS02_04520 [Fibrobacter sp.]|nr:hypothetical protein [Fibrobacter sp.]
MTLTKRISELMASLVAGIPEREFQIQLGFLAALLGEPFYLYGRSGSGKGLILERWIAAFKNAKALKIGSREQDMPDNLSSYDFIQFLAYDPRNEKIKDNAAIALEDHGKASLIFSGDMRPEDALCRGEIIDSIPLTVVLPENISSDALCDLLKTQGDVTSTRVSPGLVVTAEERSQWNEEIKKVALSEDSLKVIAGVVDVCDENKIYVSVRKWIALANIMKAMAFFNGRTETRLEDTFFLGLPIWSRSVSNKIIMDKYRQIVLKQILKDAPEILERPYNAEDLMLRVKKLLKGSNNRYETKMFNDEPCLFYRITIAGENVPLYAPLRYIETEGDFFPYNELKHEERRVRCNYHGTSSCTISVASSVKSAGIRTMSSRNTIPSANEKYEDFGVMPTHILKENDPEIMERKKTEMAEIRQEIQTVVERETKALQVLKTVFANIKSYKDDLFCNKELFTELQDRVSSLFDSTKVILGKIKEAHDLLAGQGS